MSNGPIPRPGREADRRPNERARAPRRPLLVGRFHEGSVTIWFLTAAAAPVPGPWSLAMVTTGGRRPPPGCLLPLR